MKITLYALLLFPAALGASAQESSSAYNVLKLPTSAHVAALGGANISLVADDATAGWENPALYANVADRTIGFSFMSYAAGTNWMGAQFVKAYGERHTFAAAAQYMNYGKMDETDTSGQVIGSFRAKDIIIGGGYSYLLSDRWTGGANLNFIFSNLADYSAIAFSVDVGLNYFDEENDLSLSATLSHIGTQVKAYDDGLRTHLPFGLTLGFTKGMAHLPVRVHLTLTDVTRWKSSYYVFPDAADEQNGGKVSFGRKALNHVVVGLDILPTDRVYLSLGYNFRRAYELKAAGSSHWAGISAGAGLSVKRFKLGLAYAKYHQAGNSIMANAAYSL